MWTGLFALQNQDYLEPLNDVHPGRRRSRSSTASTGAPRTSTSTRAPSACRSTCSTTTASTTRSCSRRPASTTFPTTWDELYAACDKLKAAGITPFTYGTGGQALNAGFYPYYDLSYLMMYLPVDDWKKLYNGEIAWTDPTIVAQLDQVGGPQDQGLHERGRPHQQRVRRPVRGRQGRDDARRARGTSPSSTRRWATRWASSSRRSPTRRSRASSSSRGNGFGVTSYSSTRPRPPRSSPGWRPTEAPEDHRRRRAHPDRRRAPTERPAAGQGLLELRGHAGLHALPDDRQRHAARGHGRRRPRSSTPSSAGTHDARRRRRKSMQDALNALPAEPARRHLPVID